jgi:hypothetical protein
MTESAYLQRVQDMHDAYFALFVRQDDDKQAAAWQHFRSLVLDTAQIMQAQGWGAHAYYTAYHILEESPTGRVIDMDTREDEVDVGLRWCCFVIGHDYEIDLPEEVYTGDDDEEED